MARKDHPSAGVRGRGFYMELASLGRCEKKNEQIDELQGPLGISGRGGVGLWLPQKEPRGSPVARSRGAAPQECGAPGLGSGRDSFPGSLDPPEQAASQRQSGGPKCWNWGPWSTSAPCWEGALGSGMPQVFWPPFGGRADPCVCEVCSREQRGRQRWTGAAAPGSPGVRRGEGRTDGRTDGRSEGIPPAGGRSHVPGLWALPHRPCVPRAPPLAAGAAPHSADHLSHGPEMCVLQSCWLRGPARERAECLCHHGCCHRACCHKVSAPSPGMFHCACSCVSCGMFALPW